jgi:tetratricopeptide (TPR) repeat protein
MSRFSRDFADVLLAHHVITAEQLAEARLIAQQTGARLEDVLVQLEYASTREVMVACAEALGLAYLDLSDVTIPPTVIELLPESVARENVVLPLCVTGRVITIIASDPTDVAMLEKLQFILNKHIAPVLASREQIIDAINRFYGETETESVDSFLAEFTDTAIDFTTTEDVDLVNSEFELSLDESGPVPECSEASPASPPPPVERRATVRYYHRMNPERMFPLLVILSAKEVQAIVQRGVSQARSEAFRVAEGSLVEIEPILPGCACYPPKEQVRIGAGEVSTTFWVVPHVLGKVMQARVVVRQEGQTLAEVPLEARVVKQSLTLLVGSLSLVLPFILLLLKHFRLDFESQLQDGFSLYAQIAGWLLRWLTPETLTGLLFATTAVLYFCLRPRRREVFWDIHTAGPENPLPKPIETARPTREEQIAQGKQAFERGDRAQGERLLSAVLDADPSSQEALLCLADGRYQFEDSTGALQLYQRAMARGPMRAVHYFRASLAASKLGYHAQALNILKQAAAVLPPKEMKGPLWYNMACFAARLGHYPDALVYLNRAVDSGYDDIDKLQNDPDLEALRWNAGFRRLLAGLART